MTISYEPELLTESAEKLYRRARFVALGFAVRGALIGGMGGLVGTLVAHSSNSEVVIAAVAGGCALVGFTIGADRAFGLRLEAQRTLCLLQTEINTRGRSR